MNVSRFAEALATANLLGGWNERSEADMAIVAALAVEKPTEWLRKMREVLHRPDSPLSHRDGVWTVKHRAKLWTSLESRIFGPTLEAFRTCAKTVLGEVDPKFELEPDKRFAASIYGKVPGYSWALRTGIADTLALLGTNAAKLTNCGTLAGEGTATVVVRELLEQADWKVWGSLDRLLPTLAEASPEAFMTAVEAALSQNPSPFDTLFAQRGDPMFSGNYLCGLMWALETLAWDGPNLVRVSVILATLATRDPGGNSGNTPANSLSMIFLPWLPQTRASVEKRTVAVKAVVRERREVGWKLLRSLLPSHHGTSAPTSKPKWRNKLNDDATPRPTNDEYRDQVTSYAKMAVEIARADSDKLAELIDSLDTLPEPAFNEMLAHLESEAVISLPDERRLPIWTKLTSLVRKHRAHADAKWALSSETVEKIDHAASVVVPKDPFVARRILFSNNAWNLHNDRDDWQKGEEILAGRQRSAVEEIHTMGGLGAVIAFAKTVENAWKVGYALGSLESIDIISDLLPTLVLSPEPKQGELVQGFVWAMSQRKQWTWFDLLNTESWSKDEIAQLLTYLPFDPETWKRADQRLGTDAKEYWSRVPIRTFQRADPNYVAVDALLKHGRPRAAVACLAARERDKLPLDPNRAMDALLGAVNSKESGTDMDTYGMETVIKALQDDKNTDAKRLMLVEWAYLALLEHSHVTTAKTLNAAIATDPQWFCEIIRMIFRSDRETDNEQKPERTEEQRAIAQNAYRLLHGWRTVPGTDHSGSISSELLKSWIDSVKGSLEESGHLDIGLQKAGEVFFHTPPDPDGLFINHAVADVLNREDMNELRHGYSIGVYNARGVHFVDPTGAPERQLSLTYNQRADTVENAGYHRLAATLRAIADGYTREADHVIAQSAAENRQNE